MQILASFNGGPSIGALLMALGVACLIGGVAGRYSRGMVRAFLHAFLGAVMASSLCLWLGNQPGDAAGAFFYGVLLIFCPILGVISGVIAIVARWLFGQWL